MFLGFVVVVAVHLIEGVVRSVCLELAEHVVDRDKRIIRQIEEVERTYSASME